MNKLSIFTAASILCVAAGNCLAQGNMSISPSTVQLYNSGTQQFTVSGIGPKRSVTWGISPAMGQISASGLYTAPAQINAGTTVTVTATSSTNSSKLATARITLLTAPAPPPPAPSLAITTAAWPNGTAGVAYSASCAATGGTTPYMWSVVSGALPAGLTLASSGNLGGTPTTSGSFSFSVKATDAAGTTATRAYVLSIASPAAPPPVSSAPTYYVSADQGNDAWSGLLASPNSSSTDGPFRTLAKAQAAMRASGTVKTATLRGGTYSIASTLSLNWTDDGEVWISYPGETPILDGYGTGGVSVSGVSQLTFKGLTFQNMAAYGIYLTGGPNNITIRWNKFSNCNLSCISGSGVKDSIIDSNVIDGQQSPGGSTQNAYSAIMLWYGSSNNQVTHNLISNCNGGGIAFSAGLTDPPNNNNVVDRNILRNVGTNVLDQGAIYMLDRAHLAVGNRITNNIIDGNGGTTYQTNLTKAIYLDDLMSNVVVTGNLCRKCGQYAFQIHGGDHNTISNNIFDLSSTGTVLGLYQNTPMFTSYGMTSNVFERNIVYFGTTVASSLWQVIISSSEALPVDSTNLYYAASGTIPNTGQIIDSNPYNANPQFANPSAGDYSMPASSPAYTIQFQPLANDQGPLPYAP